MLEKVMELHFLLYAMMLMGGLGALGMLTTHLTLSLIHISEPTRH